MSPTKKLNTDFTPLSNRDANVDHQSEDVRSLSYTTNIDRNSFEDASDRNSPNIEKTNSMTSDDLDTKNIVNSPKPTNNGVEPQNLNEIETEGTNVSENKSTSDNTQNDHIYSTITTNGKTTSEGRFKKLLRQFVLRKVVDSKNGNNNILSTYESAQKKKEISKPDENKVTSKVCTIL